MQTYETVIEAGPDKIVHLDIPVDGTGRRYHVVVVLSEDLPREATPTIEDRWPDRFIEETAGAWLEDFERPDQGQFELREDL